MTVRKIVMTGVFIALNIVLGFLSIPVAGSALRITFTFLVSMTYASMFNMKWCVIYAVLVDIISFFLTNSFGDVFFLGYTLSAVLGLVVYRLFFMYGVTVMKALFAKLTVNVCINVLLGSIWRVMLYTTTTTAQEFSTKFSAYASVSLLKNLAMVPIELMLFMMFYFGIKTLIDKFSV